MSTVHIAGNDIQVNNLLRQRCAWCGCILIDYDLECIAVPVGQEPRPATWPVGDLVEVEGDERSGQASWIVPHVDGDQLPANACGRVDDRG